MRSLGDPSARVGQLRVAALHGRARIPCPRCAPRLHMRSVCGSAFVVAALPIAAAAGSSAWRRGSPGAGHQSPGIRPMCARRVVGKLAVAVAPQSDRRNRADETRLFCGCAPIGPHTRRYFGGLRVIDTAAGQACLLARSRWTGTRRDRPGGRGRRVTTALPVPRARQVRRVRPARMVRRARSAAPRSSSRETQAKSSRPTPAPTPWSRSTCRPARARHRKEHALRVQRIRRPRVLPTTFRRRFRPGHGRVRHRADGPLGVRRDQCRRGDDDPAGGGDHGPPLAARGGLRFHRREQGAKYNRIDALQISG